MSAKSTAKLMTFIAYACLLLLSMLLSSVPAYLVGSVANSGAVGWVTWFALIFSFMKWGVPVFWRHVEADHERDVQRAGDRYRRITQEKADYDAALLGTDKAKALKMGRIYYSTLRGGSPTLRDEQAIQNDIMSMRN